MPRKRKKNGVQSFPNIAPRCLPEANLKRHKIKKGEINHMEALSQLFKIGMEKRPRTTNWTPDELIADVQAYFDYCAEHELKPCKAGLSLFLGIHKSTLYEWDANRTRYGDISEIIRHAVELMEAQYVNRVEAYPTGNIFLLKSSHGHKDASEITINKSASEEDVKDTISKLGLDK
jgi:Arc/MetJ-type ribon-helix-helix transcriptional regulator